MPNEAWYKFDSDLQPDEEVLWAGQPDPHVLIAKEDRSLIPFSLLWGSSALVWEAWVIVSLARGERHSGNGGNLWFFSIMGLIGVAVGLYLIFGRFIYKRWKKRRTYYAVTNRRVLVLTTLRHRYLSATPIDQVPQPQEVVNPAGIGTLYFGKSRWWQGNYGNTGMDITGRPTVLAFYDIPNARGVAELVNGLRQTLKEPAS